MRHYRFKELAFFAAIAFLSISILVLLGGLCLEGTCQERAICTLYSALDDSLLGAEVSALCGAHNLPTKLVEKTWKGKYRIFR